MRIIGGARRGKRLFTPPNHFIRPTADRVRESIFNIIAAETMANNVLDLFAGTGAMGLEALSRGTKQALFIDNHPTALALIEKNIKACGWADRTKIIRWNLSRSLNGIHSANESFNLAFIDPPYRSPLIATVLTNLVHAQVLAKRARVIVEHAAKDTLNVDPHAFIHEDRRVYGKTLVSFFRYML